MKRVVVEAPAKINLALEVTGLTDNGYHTVDMVMQAVGVWERVEVVRSMGYSLRLPKSPVPAGDNNTATKAAAAFFYETGLLAGADITIHKRVPTRAGLAGGSADAAAVLVGLNELYGAGLTMEALCRMGAKIGADVPFSLMGGTARATGIGEVITPLRSLPPCWFTIAMPSGGVSTPAAYKRFDEMGSPLSPDIASACEAINTGDLTALAANMQNMLEFSNGNATTARLRRAFDEAGALASMMTGSGAAVFGLFANEEEARRAKKVVAGMAQATFVAPPVSTGPRVIESV